MNLPSTSQEFQEGRRAGVPQFARRSGGGAARRVAFYLLILSLLSFFLVAAQISPIPRPPDTTSIASISTVDSASADFLIREGDEFVDRLFDHQRALAKYLDALAVEPNSEEIFWRISRCYVGIAEHLPSATENDRNYQLATYERALEFANKAIAADPGSSMAYARRAVATGRIAMFRGVWESSDLINSVREDAERAVELDPRNSLAHYALGRTHARTSERPWVFRIVLGLGWADIEEAVVSYERAIALRPDFITYRLWCARAYFELDEYDKAKAHLTVINTLPTLDEDDDQLRTEAKELLEKIREEEE